MFQSKSSQQETLPLGIQLMLGKLLGGRYKIISHLGGGGYGQTYLAEDIHLPNNPRCVVKQLKPQITDAWNLQTASRLFNTEAEVLYKLGNHSQIPRLFAHFEENKEFYLVQEFIDGTDLSQELTPGQPISESQVFEILQQTLEVLDFVHQQRVIHRDINPRNLIRRKQDRKLVLIDFGAVKQISTRVFNAQTQGGETVAIGTAGYMPTEQVNGHPRFCSDIYALGVIAVQALTGLDPARNQLPRDPKTGEIYWRNRAVVNPGLANIIDRMILSNFQKRYQSTNEVIHDLNNWKSSQATLNLINNNNAAPSEISPLPRSKNKKSLQPIQLGLGLAVISIILLLFKIFISQQSQAVKTSNDTAKTTLNKSSAIDSKQALIPPVTSPIPEFRLSRSKANRVARFIKQGDRMIESGQYQEALTAYNNALAIKAAYEEAYWGRCYAFANLQRYQEAIEACNKALQTNPDYYKAWWSKGNALDALKRYNEALAHYDQALKIKPDFAEALINKGATLTFLQRYEEALASYDQALKIKPDLPETWNNRGIALTNLKRYPEAIASFEKAIKIKPNYQLALENRKQAQQQLGK
ncbi:MAG TPA: serine/threonine-protein kinase [Oculatellaceae cyanobacterium]